MKQARIVLALFAVIFAALCVFSYIQKSATWDEPQHLTSGYLELVKGDYRLDPQHPPLLRLWTALPLFWKRGIQAPTDLIDTSPVCDWMASGQFFFSHHFLYQWNDGDPLLYAARFMIVLLGILLGVLVFFWTRALYGFVAASIALLFYMLEPNILAHASLVTTDFAITCFAFGAFYFLWRITQQITLGNLIGLVFFSVCAFTSKFSAFAFVPVVVILLALHVVTGNGWSWRIGIVREFVSRKSKAVIAAGIVILLSVICWVAVWACYGFRYLPSNSPTWKYQFHKECQQLWPVQQTAPRLASVIGWVDDHRLLPNAYLQGFLLGQARSQARGSYLAGRVYTEGVWYYFPIAFLVKTPLAVILLATLGLLACAVRCRTLLKNEIYLLLPMIVYVLAAVTSNLNIGLRHILPVYPILMVLIGKVTAEYFGGMRRIAVALLAVLTMVELAVVYPHYLSFFNLTSGGPAKGDRYLVDSNLDWGQDLKGLKQWMVRKGVEHINLGYFGTADPRYYGINCTFLPSPNSLWSGQGIALRLPGYVAVSVTNLRGPYSDAAGHAYYRPLLERQPEVTIGHSIRIYWVERPWW